MAVPVRRISLGAGQSYEQVGVLTNADMAAGNVPAIFGQHTCAFVDNDKIYLIHAEALNVVHISKAKPQPPGSLPYSRLVTNKDVIYGPGVVIQSNHYNDVGIPDILQGGDWWTPIVFTAQQGLLVISAATVATLMMPELSTRLYVTTDTEAVPQHVEVLDAGH